MPSYTKQQKLEALRALAEQCGNVSATSKETGISRIALNAWRENYADEYEQIDRQLYRRWLIDARAAAIRQARAKVTTWAFSSCVRDRNVDPVS